MATHRTTRSTTIPTATSLLDRLTYTSESRQRLLDAGDLVAVAQAIQREAVSDARSEGVSWTDIGRWLGISKQAAQQRFGG